MGTNSDQVITKIVEGLAEENNFSKNAKITLNRDKNKSEGFMGELVPVSLEDEKTGRTINLIAKMAAKDKNVREAAPIEECSENEIQVYEKVLPALEHLQQLARIPTPFNSIAKFYGASKEGECLILENLTISGFQMLHSRELLDDSHLKFILSRYGKFHALSFALKVLEPLKFQEISKELKNTWGITFTQKKNPKVMLKVLETTQSSLSRRGIESKHFNNYVDNLMEFLTRMAYHEETKFSCFIHGDSWSNNFMFKYKTNNGEKTLEDFKILDWQYGNVGPPVHDLSYILFSSASKEIFDNLEKYLLIYHKSLTEFLSLFNLDVNTIFPYQQLKRQWKQYYHLGALLGICIWRLRSINEEDAIDNVNYSSDDGSTYFDAMPNIKFDEEYLAEHLEILFNLLDRIENGEI